MRGEVLSFPGSDHFEKLKKDLQTADVFVDAIFGTGLNSEVKGLYREIIEHLNSLQKPIVAVDIPSGLDANTGKPLGTAIRLFSR